jgi:transposase
LVDTTWEDKMVFMEEKKPRARRRFTAEFKTRAVGLVVGEGRPIKEVARDLDLSDSVLHGWCKRAKIDKGLGPPGALTTDERLELAQLRKENRILKEEKEILRKAAAFFAKEGR